MAMLKKIHVRSYEVGLTFRDDDFVGLLGSARPKSVSSASEIRGWSMSSLT
ncbi:MAG: hypothetical protein ACF788_12870 [Novipirellula sp. JB048]